MIKRLSIAAVLLPMLVAPVSADSQFESPKVSAGVVVQGTSLDSPKLSPGIVVQNLAVQAPKISPGIVVQNLTFQAVKVSVGIVVLQRGGGVVPRAPLTHW